jgi:hypothetical protein
MLSRSPYHLVVMAIIKHAKLQTSRHNPTAMNPLLSRYKSLLTEEVMRKYAGLELKPNSKRSNFFLFNFIYDMPFRRNQVRQTDLGIYEFTSWGNEMSVPELIITYIPFSFVLCTRWRRKLKKQPISEDSGASKELYVLWSTFEAMTVWARPGKVGPEDFRLRNMSLSIRCPIIDSLCT